MRDIFTSTRGAQERPWSHDVAILIVVLLIVGVIAVLTDGPLWIGVAVVAGVVLFMAEKALRQWRRNRKPQA